MVGCVVLVCFFFFKQKTAYEMRISDWSSDVGSSDLVPARLAGHSFTAWLPDNVQTISGDNLETLIAGPGGGAVLAQVGDRDLYILADPDLIHNLAFASRDRAVGGAILDEAIADYADADGLAFDVTLQGFARARPLPPFPHLPPLHRHPPVPQ